MQSKAQWPEVQLLGPPHLRARRQRGARRPLLHFHVQLRGMGESREHFGPRESQAQFRARFLNCFQAQIRFPPRTHRTTKGRSRSSRWRVRLFRGRLKLPQDSGAGRRSSSRGRHSKVQRDDDCSKRASGQDNPHGRRAPGRAGAAAPAARTPRVSRTNIFEDRRSRPRLPPRQRTRPPPAPLRSP